jgi:predicted phosphodiesterase
VRACFSEFKKREVDGIYLNGDILDMEEVSRFEKMPTKMYLKDEIDVGRKFLESLRKLFPNIPIYWKDGNHEKRLQSYIATRCDELANLYGLDIPTQLQFDKYNITYVPEHKVAKFGKLWIAHGHELGLKSGTVNIARQVRMRVGVNVMFGHWHKNQNDSSRNLADEVHSAWSIGCLCYLKPRYTGVLNQWTQGGATIDLHDEGNFTVSTFQIQDGVVI